MQQSTFMQIGCKVTVTQWQCQRLQWNIDQRRHPYWSATCPKSSRTFITFLPHKTKMHYYEEQVGGEIERYVFLYLIRIVERSLICSSTLSDQKINCSSTGSASMQIHTLHISGLRFSRQDTHKHTYQGSHSVMGWEMRCLVLKWTWTLQAFKPAVWGVTTQRLPQADLSGLCKAGGTEVDTVQPRAIAEMA